MPQDRKRIRVGLIGCNKRALWYGAIFDEIGPEAYAVLDPAAYHHLTFYSYVELMHERARGFKLAKLYDRSPKAAEQTAAAFGGRPVVCRMLDELPDDVDLVFIANESGDGSAHLKLATPGLRKRIPTFIDRPLARTVKDAMALISLARRKRVPLLSCSHLRMLPHVARFKSRFAEIDPIERGIVHGHGPNPAHVADGIQLALFLFGDEFDGRAEDVRSMGEWPLEIVLAQYAKAQSGRRMFTLVVNSHMSGARHAFHASASSNMKPIYLDDLEAFVQSEGGLAVMNAVKKMVRTGRPALPYGEMIEPVAVAEAGRKAHNKAKAVALKGLR